MEYRGYHDLNGSYKLSGEIISKLTANGSDTAKHDTISNYELMAVIYFSHICDIEGNIEDFKTVSLTTVLGCSRRAAYHILNNLCEKGFISAGKSDWYGRRDIKLLGNDFRGADYHKVRYLNTNFTFFNHNHEDYKRFKALSLYAKKTLIYILFHYNIRFGYRVSLDALLNELGLAKKRLVLNYIDELKEMFTPAFFEIQDSKTLRQKYATLRIRSKNPFFAPNAGIKADQDTHFKYKLSHFMERNHIEIQSVDATQKENDLIHSLYTLTVSFLNKQLSYQAIENAVFLILRENGCLDEITLFRIDHYLTETYPLKCG